MRTLCACFYLWKQLLVCFSPSNENCHRISRRFLQLSLKWLNSWFSLTDCAQIPSCLSWKCAHSSVILVFILQEMAASLIFFCSVTKIRKHEISGGGEILRQLNDELQIWFSQKGIAICCATETLCYHDSWSVRVFLHREESLRRAPVVSQFTAFLSCGPRTVNHCCCSTW